MSYNNQLNRLQTDQEHRFNQHHHLPQQQQQQQQQNRLDPAANFLDYSLDTLDADDYNNTQRHHSIQHNTSGNMTVDSSTNFDAIFDTLGTDSNAQANRQQTQHHHQQQARQSTNNTSFTDSNNNNSNNNNTNSNASNDKIGISTSNITNPALSSFFQLPFELQVQQFPVTNPPLFDFQQAYYQYSNFGYNQPGHDLMHTDHAQYSDLNTQGFPNQQPPSAAQRGAFSPHAQPSNAHLQHNFPGYQNQQPTLRRRISISNGQIGQLVQFTQQQIALANPTYSPEAVAAATAVAMQQNNASTPEAVAAASAAAQQAQQPPPPQATPQQQPLQRGPQDPSHHSPQSQPSHSRQQQQQAQQQQQQPQAPPNVTSPLQGISPQANTGGAPVVKRETKAQQFNTPSPQQQPPVAGKPHPSGLATNANGVPQHQLIYNNEVIFNPNGGPIPGTSAWKKQKLLERNRIAASKCRQRKKQQQQRLEQDIDKFVRDNQNLSMQVKMLEKKLLKFTKIMEMHFEKFHEGDNSFPLLKELINDTEEEFAKVKLEDDDQENDNDDALDQYDDDDDDADEDDDTGHGPDGYMNRSTDAEETFDYRNAGMTIS